MNGPSGERCTIVRRSWSLPTVHTNKKKRHVILVVSLVLGRNLVEFSLVCITCRPRRPVGFHCHLPSVTILAQTDIGNRRQTVCLEPKAFPSWRGTSRPVARQEQRHTKKTFGGVALAKLLTDSDHSAERLHRHRLNSAVAHLIVRCGHDPAN